MIREDYFGKDISQEEFAKESKKIMDEMGEDKFKEMLLMLKAEIRKAHLGITD